MELHDNYGIGAFFVVVLSFFAWFMLRFNEWRFVRGMHKAAAGTRLPPGSMGLPLLGEMIDFLRCFKYSKTPDLFIAKRKIRYGDTGVYRTHLFGSPAILTCSPEVNKEILHSSIEEGKFSAGWPSSGLLLGSSSVGVVDGLLHKRLRRHLMEAFNSPKALALHLASAQPMFISALEQWVSKGKIVAYNETKAITFRNICDVLVSFKSKTLLDTMEADYRGLMAGLRAMTINVPGTAFHHAINCRKNLNRIIAEELRERKLMCTTDHEKKHDDFMQILIDSTDADGNKLGEAEVIDNIVALILGGYESTSDVMTWALYYLAKYPHVLDKLKEETRSIRMHKPEDELLMAEDIKSMKYTAKVAEELIRLSNVSPFIFRKVVRDDVVINGYKFPKNWRVLVWIRSIHVDSQYFPDPLAFDPDRWENFKAKPGIYSVFGSGQRYCVGNNFARTQVMMFLHHLCLNYRWELLNPDAGFAYQPHPKPEDGAEMAFGRAT
ncbi:ent-kaurenoic acid oxidase 2-like [Iris pallida]|uniref:Ent-kaurenoic acid oxidase 2-like n=1 Tax=Iris pallida TaxID=29817 RepID=A0AAX6E9Y3_IRIPA|nr:ent-kaurenoic acid oxidase 2-like [Iris pallida]